MVIIFFIIITGFDLCFPDIGEPFPSSYLWLRAIGWIILYRWNWNIFLFSLPGLSRYWRHLGSEQSYQVNGKDYLMACPGISIFWGLLEKRNAPRQNLMASPWHGFPGLERPFRNLVWGSFWGITPETIWRSLCGQWTRLILDTDVLIWLCLMEMRVILGKKDYASIDRKF